MLQIQGTLQVIPVSVHTESGTLRVDEGQPEQPAVVQTYVSLNGPVQVVFPADTVPQLIEQLQNAADEANSKPSSDIYIPSSMQEAEAIAKTQEQLTGEADAASRSEK